MKVNCWRVEVYEPVEGKYYTYIFAHLKAVIDSVETTWCCSADKPRRMNLVDNKGLPVTDRVAWRDGDGTVVVDAHRLCGEIHERAVHF